MEFKTEHIGAYGGNPASIIELTVISDNTEVTETINEFSTNKVDDNFIMALRELEGQSEQLPPQICYKTNEPCKHNCSGLCKESC